MSLFVLIRIVFNGFSLFGGLGVLEPDVFVAVGGCYNRHCCFFSLRYGRFSLACRRATMCVCREQRMDWKRKNFSWKFGSIIQPVPLSERFTELCFSPTFTASSEKNQSFGSGEDRGLRGGSRLTKFNIYKWLGRGSLDSIFCTGVWRRRPQKRFYCKRLYSEVKNPKYNISYGYVSFLRKRAGRARLFSRMDLSTALRLEAQVLIGPARYMGREWGMVVRGMPPEFIFSTPLPSEVALGLHTVFFLFGTPHNGRRVGGEIVFADLDFNIRLLNNFLCNGEQFELFECRLAGLERSWNSGVLAGKELGYLINFVGYGRSRRPYLWVCSLNELFFSVIEGLVGHQGAPVVGWPGALIFGRKTFLQFPPRPYPRLPFFATPARLREIDKPARVNMRGEPVDNFNPRGYKPYFFKTGTEDDV